MSILPNSEISALNLPTKELILKTPIRQIQLHSIPESFMCNDFTADYAPGRHL